MSETPIDLDKHRGMAAQRRRTSAAWSRKSRPRRRCYASAKGLSKSKLLSVPAANCPDAVGALRLEPMRPVSHRLIPIIATSLNPCWRI